MTLTELIDKLKKADTKNLDEALKTLDEEERRAFWEMILAKV